jgi:hypothetical protein
MTPYARDLDRVETSERRGSPGENGAPRRTRAARGRAALGHEPSRRPQGRGAAIGEAQRILVTPADNFFANCRIRVILCLDRSRRPPLEASAWVDAPSHRREGAAVKRFDRKPLKWLSVVSSKALTKLDRT